ncbi:MAG: MOSC domain-containing protein [Dehalococcoidia bacterium]
MTSMTPETSMDGSHVAALYHHPVKGLTPESVEHLKVLASGAVEGDRVLGLQLADAGPPVRGEWWPKDRFVTLMTTPGLARLDARFDVESRRLRLEAGGELLASAQLDDVSERSALEAAATEFVLSLDENPLAGRPERAPLRLVGDGRTPRFHDRGARQVTILNRASVRALTEAIGAPIDERRFRGNVVLDGLAPWDELTWVGRDIVLGSTRFRVTGPVIRCLATHADPEGGGHDLPVMQTLVRAFEQEQPTMGVLAEMRGGGGDLDVGAGLEVRAES